MAQKLKAKVANSRVMKASIIVFVLIFAVIGTVLLLNSKAAVPGSPAPPSMYITPTTGTVNSGASFTVDVYENSGTTPVNAVQVNLTYDSAKLTVTNIDTSAGTFKQVLESGSGSGNLTIVAALQAQNDYSTTPPTPIETTPVTGEQKIATITFTATTTAGAAAVSFASGSAILAHSDASNILPSLSSTNTGSYTVVSPDTTPPNTTITSTAPTSTATSKTFTYTSSETGSTFECKLDAPGSTGTFASCPSGGITYNFTTAGSHTFSVRAKDAAGNIDQTPATQTWTYTPADTTAPTVSVTAPTAGQTVSGANVSLAATANDAVGVAGVQFYLDPTVSGGVIDTTANSAKKIGAEDTSSPFTATWNTTTLGNGTHTIGAVARDAAGNKGSSAIITVTVSNVVITDTTKPNPPSGLNSSSISQTGFTLGWNAATDPAGASGEPVTGVASYNIYQATNSAGPFSLLKNVTGTSTGITGLNASTNYYYQVESKDGAGNVSATKSATLTVRTSDKPALSGDVNGDHIVNYLDLSDLLSHWKQSYAAADFVKTGSSANIIDIYDLSVLLSNYAKSN